MNYKSSQVIKEELIESRNVNVINTTDKILSDNLFAYDFQYSNIFTKEKEQTDDDFYETFNNLNSKIKNEEEKNSPQLANNPNELHENSSFKDESLINKDILNFLESPSLNNSIKKKRKCSTTSNYSDENVKRLSVNTRIIKNLKLNQEKNSEDFEIKLFKISDKENISPIILRECANKILEDIKEEEHEKIESLNTSNISEELLKKKNYISKELFNNSLYSLNNNIVPNQSIPKYYFNQTIQKNVIDLSFDNKPLTLTNENMDHNNNSQQNTNLINSNNPFKINNIFYPSPRDIINISNMFKIQHNIQTPLKSIYDSFNNNTLNCYNFKEIKNKEHIDSHFKPSMNVTAKDYEDFNKFNSSKVESSELNSRELKTTKIIKIPNPNDFEELSSEEIEKYAFSLAKDQAGCRFLQKKLDETPELATRIFHKLIERIIELMNDSFGNYLVQKILEKVNDVMIEETLLNIEPHFLSLGLNPHGTRVIQKLIEVLSNDKLLYLFSKMFSPNVLNFIKDINGNHIIQKFVFTIGNPKNQFLYDIIINKLIEIGTHKHGCCVLQKCIEGGSQKQRDELIKKIVLNTKTFVSDQYGNYVVQYVINMRDFTVNNLIANEFLQLNIINLSIQKFSSNVVEKCFDNCNDETRLNIIKHLSHPEVVYHILFDNYGNYVLQKALCYSREPYYSLLIKYVTPLMEKLKFHPTFGNKLYIKLINYFPELNNVPSNSESQKNNNNIVNNNSYLNHKPIMNINDVNNTKRIINNKIAKLKINKFSQDN